MSNAQQETPLPQEPLVIYAAREFDGFTYQLDLGSFARVRLSLKDPTRQFPRIFISYDVKEDFQKLVGPTKRELVLLLTGLSEEHVAQLGGIEFRDPQTDHTLFVWRPS